MSEDAEYYSYLRGRNVRSFLYRRFWLYSRIGRQISGRVLDVGCGIGDFLAFRPGTEGVDVNPHTVAWCHRRGLPARLMAVDQLPYEDRSFDAVVLDNVLEHLTAPQPLLSEIHRVLADGGRVVVGVPGAVGFARDGDHKIFYDDPRLAQVMRAAGFRKVRSFYMPLRSEWLAARIPQYCLYGVFARGLDGPSV